MADKSQKTAIFLTMKKRKGKQPGKVVVGNGNFLLNASVRPLSANI
jgi:hypothetical protein